MSVVQGIASAIGSICGFAVAAYMIFVMWRIFVKAGEKGWKAIIPGYDLWILCKIVWGKGKYMFFFLIPVYDIIFDFKTSTRMAKAFGKSTGFGVGIFFIGEVFESIIAFDHSTYQGPQTW